MLHTARQNTGGIHSFTLKIIAILAMTSDHIGIVFWNWLPVWGRALLFAPGGLTFPIMAFLLTEGYRHTRNFNRYALRLFAFALVSLVPFWLAMGNFRGNVLFTLLLGLIAIRLYDTMQNRGLFVLAFVGLTLLTLFTDWNLVGVPMVLLCHVTKEPRKRVWAPIALVWAAMLLPTALMALAGPAGAFAETLPSMLFLAVGCTASIPLLARYNGQRGRSLKYIFYLYYPLHLVLLVLLRGFMFGVWW